MLNDTEAEQEQHIATLVHTDEYARNANQMASVSSRKLVFIKRKELALKPFELLEFELQQCSAISYQIKWALVPMILGALLAALVLSILWLVSQGEIASTTTRIPIGALAIALIFGVLLLQGPQRHRLTFIVNGKALTWQSKAGDFKYKVASVQKVVAFAREQGLLKESVKSGT
jgi:hypothetical protein